MLAVGHAELEGQLLDLQSKGDFTIIENESDMDLLADALQYEHCDCIVANSLLSKEKLIKLAAAARENGGANVIVLIESFQDREYIAHLVGLGVCSFHLVTDLSGVAQDIHEYPAQFNFRLLAGSEKSNVPIVTHSMRPMGTVSFGVFSVNPGAGATTFVWTLASWIAGQGHETAVVDLSGTDALQQMPGRKQITVLAPGGNKPEEEDSLLQIAYSSMEHPFLIIDFGRLFEFEPQGEGTPLLKQARKGRLDDFLRCNYKIGLGFAEPWHSYPIDFFRNELFLEDLRAGQLQFLLSAADGKEIEKASERHGVSLWDRANSESLVDELMRQAGVHTKEKPAAKLGLLRRWK